MSRLFDFLFHKKEEEKRELHVPKVEDYYSVVAKEMYGGEDIKFMYHTAELPGLCPSCHCKIEMIPDLSYRPNKRKLDAYCTYDGFSIVSDKFKRFCDLNNYDNLKFLKLHSGRYYYFEPLSTIKTNIYWNPATKVGKWCDVCKQYSEVCGPYTLIDDSVTLESDDFIMRDYYFRRSNWAKGPNIIVGLKTMEKMKAFGLKGVYFYDVWGIKK